MKLSILGLTLAAVLSLAYAADAHHSSAGIDRSRTATVEGTIREFRWANPHSWIEMDVVNEAGETEIWNLEMLPPSYLIPAGWTRSTIKPGDVVTIEANPFINGDPGGIFVAITLPDGERLTQRAGRGGARGGRGN